MNNLHRKIVLLLLLSTLLAVPGAGAAPWRESLRAEKAAASWLLDLVRRAWSLWPDVRTREGCNIDPNGGCTTGASPAPPPAGLEEGCDIDPDGCAAVKADTGCHIDPNGLCRRL